ncbi:MAG: response regulator [Desulfobacterales bacterium]|nr:MAG: response regulator [Desulfobacterales bacterium]
MANILIVDNQEWVQDLCKQGLTGEGYTVSSTDDVETVSKNIISLKPNLVLLNQYLKHGFYVWDVFNDIKMQDQNLPVLIVTDHDTHLYVSKLSQADGYIVKSHTAGDELRQKVSALLGRGPAVRKTKEIKKHDDKISY